MESSWASTLFTGPDRCSRSSPAPLPPAWRGWRWRGVDRGLADGARGQLGDEGVSDPGVDHDAFGRHADLPGVHERAERRPRVLGLGGDRSPVSANALPLENVSAERGASRHDDDGISL